MNAEFAVNMPNGDIVVPARHDMRIDADADWNLRMDLPKMLEHRKIVDVDLYAEFCGFLDLFK